ncbi:MAG: GlsB/YeaQ/YmgE family stress response membrane protein [Chthoniobacterales bacterium]
MEREPGMLSVVQVVVWLIIGLLGGSLAGLLIKRERTGFGILRNLGLGLVGAFVGGLLFRLFGLFSELHKISISLRDVMAAIVGSLLVLAALWAWRRQRD